MKRICPICSREISTNRNGKICRHGFKKNRWIFDDDSSLNDSEYKKVDSTPCPGSGKIGLRNK